MLLATSEQIKTIDNNALSLLGIPLYDLIGRAGAAIARVVSERVPRGGKIVVLAGKGNNGADGYAAAKLLLADYGVTVVDVFGVGQRGADGKRYAEEFLALGGRLKLYTDIEELRADVSCADCIIDAIFGTGVSGELPVFLSDVAEVIRESVNTLLLAVDLPLGVSSDDGCVNEPFVYSADITLALCLPKPAHFSYPAKKYVGNLVFDNIDLQINGIIDKNEFMYRLVDEREAFELLPKRAADSNKGSFGRLLMITGSREYPGAGRLSLEAALRGGVGLVTYLGESDEVLKVQRDFPEAIYKHRPPFSCLKEEDISDVVSLASKHGGVLIGSGCGRSEGLLNLVKALLTSYSGYLVLDADAINMLSENRDEALGLIRDSAATVILTPHPLELSRLTGLSVESVNANRISVVKELSRECRSVTVLKGAATVTTDGDSVLINSSGSSALAKGGSGDVLAGLVASLVTSSGDALSSTAAAVYLHGRAGDDLSSELSEFGVTPSDLPKQIARNIVKIVNNHSLK